MWKPLRLFVNRPLVYFLIGAFVFCTMPYMVAESYSFTGPEGNTINFDGDSISGDFEGDSYYVDEDSASVNGHDVEDDGGGGGGSNAGAVIAVVAVVAVVAGVGIWWYVKNHNAKTADNTEVKDYLVEHKLSDSASIAVTPRMMQVAGVAPEDIPDLNLKDFASADISFRLKF